MTLMVVKGFQNLFLAIQHGVFDNVLSIILGLQGGNALSEQDFVCKFLKDYCVHSPPPHVQKEI